VFFDLAVVAEHRHGRGADQRAGSEPEAHRGDDVGHVVRVGGRHEEDRQIGAGPDGVQNRSDDLSGRFDGVGMLGEGRGEGHARPVRR